MLFAILLVADLATATPSSAPSAPPTAVATPTSPPAIAFDQIDRYYIDIAVPQPGGFAALEAQLLANDVADDSYPPPAGSGTLGGNGLLGRAQRMQAGLVQRYRFLGALSRVDDLNTKKATIDRPDRGQIIYLDLAAQTYRIVAGSAAQAISQPQDQAALLRQDSKPQCPRTSRRERSSSNRQVFQARRSVHDRSTASRPMDTN
ncbi:MAG TPA: hypothetical protein VME66_05135 [Candidatus Acidoferrales bacterium]|nr:hypothetical protein [Candidatus Acidoferrales bacterium]